MQSERWVATVEPRVQAGPSGMWMTNREQAIVPATLGRWLGDTGSARLTTLAQLGVTVGQGLRTGANQFFYVDYISEADSEVLVAPDPIFGISKVRVPAHCTLPVLRKQSELADEFQLSPGHLNGRVLALQTMILPEQLASDVAAKTISSEALRTAYTEMPTDLAELVRVAARTNVGTRTEPRHIPEMSAVRTNAREAAISPLKLPRYWYMLPAFAPRHRPDLFLPRVNNDHPKTYLNSDERVLIDANFSTLWLQDEVQVDKWALLAILNSSWCLAAMELTGSVMGGGALKLEAVHLRRLPLPDLASHQWYCLSELGKSLAAGESATEILAKVDRLVIEALVGSGNVEKKYAELVDIKQFQLSLRMRKS